jgi:hypothetical protein
MTRVTDLTAVSEHRDALAWADAQVAASRDDPAARLELMERLFHGSTGRAPRHLPFRRAALSFMRWQAQRGVLSPLEVAVPGSVWWMNVALARVLYAHALVAAPRLALGRIAPVARVLGDPRLGMVGAFLSLRRVIPNDYPLTRDVEWYIADEQRLGRLLDYAVIVPRLQHLYEWSADELGEPRLLRLVREGSPIYAWPYEQRHVWRTERLPFPGVVLERLTRAR